jgi:hypothetical protein
VEGVKQRWQTAAGDSHARWGDKRQVGTATMLESSFHFSKLVTAFARAFAHVLHAVLFSYCGGCAGTNAQTPWDSLGANTIHRVTSNAKQKQLSGNNQSVLSTNLSESVAGVAMLYYDYWRCCSHLPAGLAIGVILVVCGVAFIADLSFTLAAVPGDCVQVPLLVDCASTGAVIGIIIFFVVWVLCCINLVVGVAREDRKARWFIFARKSLL